MQVLDFDYDLEMGFCHIIVGGKFEGDKMTVQCCLKIDPPKHEWPIESPKFLEVIERGDCGQLGICGDVNQEAFNYWGESQCLTALFNKAKSAGIIIE